MRRERHGKGVIFSLISILIAAFILLLFWNANAPSLDVTQPAVETRVTVMDHYLASWDAYVGDATRATTRAALYGLTQRLANNQTVYSLVAIQGNLSDCLMTGSADFAANGPSSCFYGGVSDSLDARLANFSRLAKDELGIDTKYAIGGISVRDSAPFEIELRFTINSTITDPSFASWNRSKEYDTYVSVEGLPDPLFVRGGDSIMKPKRNKYDLRRRNLTQYPSPRERLNKSGVVNLVTQRQYVEDRRLAPTYLERLRGDVTSLDPQNISGIETLIAPRDTTFSSSIYQNLSFTFHQLYDYYYNGGSMFVCGNDSGNATYRIAGFDYQNFALDVPHLAAYSFNGSVYNNCS